MENDLNKVKEFLENKMKQNEIGSRAWNEYYDMINIVKQAQLDFDHYCISDWTINSVLTDLDDLEDSMNTLSDEFDVVLDDVTSKIDDIRITLNNKD